MMHEIACRHCKASRERSEELEEEVRQLREQLAGTALDIADVPYRVLKLTPYGIGIITVWGKGWSLDAGAKDKIMALTTESAETPRRPPGRPPTGSPQRYDEVQAAVIAALEIAPFGLTWYALRRAANVGDSKLTQAVQTLINGRRLRRDFARGGNQFVYSLEREALAS